MATRFRLPRPSFAFFLQAAACLVVAWSLWNGGLTGPQTPGGAEQPPGASAPDAATINPFKEGVIDRSGVPASAAPADPANAATATTAPSTAAPAGAPAVAAAPSAAPAAAAGAPVRLAGAAGFEGAQLALSSIDVIVSRNDTLDRIFRRLKLNVADLASLRALPGLKAHLDSLHPGESLHFMHRDGELFGLNRRLNDAQTLQVTRSGDALKADVVQNALETRARTVGGRISSSLFEARTIRPRSSSPTSSAGTSTSCSTCGPGTLSSSPTRRSGATGIT
jgi:hypothetical protein